MPVKFDFDEAYMDLIRPGFRQIDRERTLMNVLNNFHTLSPHQQQLICGSTCSMRLWIETLKYWSQSYQNFPCKFEAYNNVVTAQISSLQSCLQTFARSLGDCKDDTLHSEFVALSRDWIKHHAFNFLWIVWVCTFTTSAQLHLLGSMLLDTYLDSEFKHVLKCSSRN